MASLAIALIRSLRALSEIALQPLLPAAALAVIAYGPAGLKPTVGVRVAHRALNTCASNNWSITRQPGWEWQSEIAVVTGGCSGIGQALVHGLARKGMRVAIIDVQEPPNDLRCLSNVSFWQVDVTSDPAIHEAANDIRKKLGHPSILINNAGVAYWHPIIDTPADKLERILRINLLCHWTLTREFLPAMIIHHRRTRGPPGTTYAIVEDRPTLGGTWDLFRYPGIRSDSDVFTFGFSWNPWSGDRPLANGPEILAYLEQSAASTGIRNRIRFNHRVTSASWSSQDSSWTVNVVVDQARVETIAARFIILGTGFYDFEQPLEYVVPGIEKFKGPVVQPQFWPEQLDYVNKKVVIIGSGATAVTLLPNIALDAAHATMLQRSPTYIASVPNSRSLLARVATALLPLRIAARICRAQYMTMTSIFYRYCVSNPATAKGILLARAAKQLPPSISVDPHFTPRYNPWDQRLCVCPDGDFYRCLRSGKASVVTDTIEDMSENEIKLASGARLPADILVAATGLKLRFAGGIQLFIDGEPVGPAEKLSWKGCMIQDVPNLAFIIGYVNASWTLGADASSTLLVRLMELMKKKSALSATPRRRSEAAVQREPIFGLSSTYIRNVSRIFPSGATGQWALKKDYRTDMREARRGDIQSEMEFR